MSKTVLDLAIGQEAVVKDFSESSVACKLLTIGVVPKTKLTLIRKGPFGRTLCIKLGNTFIAVRESEAVAINLE